MNKSESIVEISKALSDFQKELQQPFKDADNPFFKSKYVPLESVVESITNVAPEHGLSFVQWALNDDNGRVGVATMLMHTSGEYIEFDPVFMQAEKQTPQGAGALITYLKRYTLSAVFGITSDKDDDANESSGNGQSQPMQRRQQAPITQEQVGNIKTKAMKFAELRNASIQDVYKALNITDLTKLGKNEADKSIKYLDKWIGNANKKDDAS